MNALRKNAKNLHFLAFWAKMANFGPFLVKMGKTRIFFKKALGKILSRLQALTNCKVSEKSNYRFWSNPVTNARTDAKTDVNPQVSNDFVERPKNQKILMNGLRKNAKNLHFWAFWAKMANFGPFLAKMGKTGIFFKKALGTLFSRLQALTN